MRAPWRCLWLVPVALAAGCREQTSTSATAATVPPATPVAAPAEPATSMADPEPPAPKVTVVTTAPELLKAVAALKGKTVLVNFWATWCDSCLEEFPDLIKTRDKYADQGVVLVTVSGDFEEDLQTKVIPFLTEHKVKEHAFLCAPKDQNEFINGVCKDWSGAYPATFVYDTSGQMVEFVQEGQSLEQFDALVRRHLPAK